MKFSIRCALALAGAAHSIAIQAAGFPGVVVSYNPGALPASVAGYTNSAILLAEPARSTPGPWGGPIDPFNPPYLNSQLLSLGTNGSVTLAFDRPVLNNAKNPFGVDFVLYGNAGFVITNGDYSGGGVTDGSVFGKNGTLKVSVSRDNAQYYELKPAGSPAGLGLFPTDGIGAFGLAVDPSIKPGDFAGKSLAGIRELYRGSAGGAGYDIDWARDSQGAILVLNEIHYVRIETTEGHFELGGIAAVSSGPVAGFSLSQDFSGDPANSGWRIAGDTSLFQWDAGAGALAVTWDSSKTNSYYYHFLPRELGMADSFSLECDLTLRDIQAGVSPGKSFAFELAVGLQNSSDAQSPQFQRGTSQNSPNLVEFDYFPDTGFGATISPVIVSSNSQFKPSFSFPLPLDPNKTYRLSMSYASSNRTLRTTVTLEGLSIGAINDVVLPQDFSDFKVDAVSISSYSDTGAGGSILAHGIVDNIKVTAASPSVLTIQGERNLSEYRVRFPASARQAYALERSTDLLSWTQVLDWKPGLDGEMELADPESPVSTSFYRVKARTP